MITIHNVYKSYRSENEDLTALSDINLTVRDSEAVCIVGPSGCGKSTLLRMIAGLDQPTRGMVTTDNAKIGMVFQHFALFPWLTVLQNVEFGLRMHHVNLTDVQTAIKDQLELIKLSEFAHLHPQELSGGMKQRVGIARALVIKPNILLLDEPFSALDELTSQDLRTELNNIWMQTKMTTVMVTHLIADAVELGDRVIIMGTNPGHVIREVKIDLPRPRNLRSPEFYRYVDEIAAELRKSRNQ